MTKSNMDLVKELREKTQVSLMDCRKALEESQGDIEKAIEFLRKKGASVAAKRAENATDNGRIEAYISDDFKHGSLVEVVCETDFSANTDVMKEFAIHAAKLATQDSCSDIAKLFADHKELQDHHNDILAKIAENIQVGAIKNFSVGKFGIVNAYIHPGSTVGALIELETEQDGSAHLEELKNLSRDICMHIAVFKPLCIAPEDLDQSLVEKERDIVKEQVAGSNKPANIIEKMITGKLSKYYQDVCLTQQKFIKNEDVTVERQLAEVGNKIKNTIKIKQFARFTVGKK
ncbi:translation elongation factor Ts [Candidatus Babeliales bacterium]|nr:translation elongation factor Ts [Candidatus Babeliales bacterium]